VGRNEVGDYVRIDRETGCWVWARSVGTHGYGVAWDNRTRRKTTAHRYVYEILVGPIPAGLTLDHLCRNRLCVRPAHLEPVTHRTNIRRGTSPNIVASRTGVCRNGHRDWITRPNGDRLCRTCRDTRMRAWRIKRGSARVEA